jgi:hypothetical protein
MTATITRPASATTDLTIVKSAETFPGHAIAILSGTHYRTGNTYYVVASVNDTHYVAIHRPRTWAEARRLANLEWTKATRPVRACVPGGRVCCGMIHS